MENIKQKVLGVIPSRYSSTRFPGKPLAKIGGKEMVICVYERVVESGLFDKVVVATDNRQIYDTVKRYGYEALMTNTNHSCGTERCNEVLSILEENQEYYDIIVNIQGDEPLIMKEQLLQVIELFADQTTQIATLCRVIETVDNLTSPNVVKVVFGETKEALYFSRSVIPYDREETLEYGIAKGQYYKHIGLYAYKPEILKSIVKLHPSKLERIESLEQLRWLEEGYKIKVNITEFDSIGIDTMEDLDKLNKYIDNQ